MTKEKVFFDKTDAKIISGVAIILMLAHHMFSFPNVINDGVKIVDFIRINDYLTISQYIGYFCKICVPMFAFMSGYALWVNRKSFSSYRNLKKRGTKFLVQYWIIYLLFLIFGLATGDEMPDAKTFIMNLWLSHHNV